jgi:hypothetical protein
MTKPEEFVKQIENFLSTRVGAILTRSVLKNSLAKLNKNIDTLKKNDGRVLIEDIVKAVSLFSTKDESGQIKAELEKSLNMLN